MRWLQNNDPSVTLNTVTWVWSMKVSKWWQNCNCWVNCFFKCAIWFLDKYHRWYISNRVHFFYQGQKTANRQFYLDHPPSQHTHPAIIFAISVSSPSSVIPFHPVSCCRKSRSLLQLIHLDRRRSSDWHVKQPTTVCFAYRCFSEVGLSELH